MPLVGPARRHGRRRVELVVERERRLLSRQADRPEADVQDGLDALGAPRARLRLEGLVQPQDLPGGRRARDDRVVGGVGRRARRDEQGLLQAAPVVGVRVCARPLGDDAGLVGHVEVAVRRAELDRVAEAARRGVRVVLRRAARVVELVAVLRRVAGGGAHLIADRLELRLVGRGAGGAGSGRAQDERGDVVQRDERRDLVRADEVPDGLDLGLRARRGPVVALRRDVGRAARAAPVVAVVAVGVDAPGELARQRRREDLAVAVLAPVGELAAERGDRLDERDVRVLAELVAEVEGVARGDEAVGVDERQDDDALLGEQAGDAGVALLLHEHVGELHRGLHRRPLAGVVDRHEEVHGPPVVVVDVLGDLDPRDLAALVARAEDDLAHEAGVGVDEALELGLHLLVRAVRRAARRQRRAGGADARRVAAVGGARGREGLREVADADRVAQAGGDDLGQVGRAGHEDVGPAEPARVGDVEAGGLERVELLLGAVHAQQLQQAGELGQREGRQAKRRARVASGLRARAAADGVQALALGHAGLHDLTATERARRAERAAREVAQLEIPVAGAAQAHVEKARLRRRVRRRCARSALLRRQRLGDRRQRLRGDGGTGGRREEEPGNRAESEEHEPWHRNPFARGTAANSAE